MKNWLLRALMRTIICAKVLEENLLWHRAFMATYAAISQRLICWLVFKKWGISHNETSLRNFLASERENVCVCVFFQGIMCEWVCVKGQIQSFWTEAADCKHAELIFIILYMFCLPCTCLNQHIPQVTPTLALILLFAGYQLNITAHYLIFNALTLLCVWVWCGDSSIDSIIRDLTWRVNAEHQHYCIK